MRARLPRIRWPSFSSRSLLALLAFVLGLGTVPHRLCERDAKAYYEGDAASVDALAASVSRWTEKDLAPTAFATGSTRFDGEWLFGTYMMAAMGFGQVALQSTGARRAENIGHMERCLDMMLGEGARAFDRAAWSGTDALASTTVAPGSEADRGHVAYLGYAGLPLGLHRVLVAESRFDRTHDALVSALARRFDASPVGLLETYPGEVYPVDNAAALGAIALHARATHVPAPGALGKGLDAIRAHGIDPKSGLVVQAVDPASGRARDAARGSGTALASWFLLYADPATSASLYRAVHKELHRTVLGFGAVLEYGATQPGRGDIDSGPILFGFGVSATGFAIGPSRAHGERDAFASLYATAHLFGAPFDGKASRTFATGGPIGDAILFAMLTTPRLDDLRTPS